MGRGDSLGVEVFVKCFEGLERDLWVGGNSGGRRDEARAKFGWVLRCACTREAVVNDILGAEILIRGLVLTWEDEELTYKEVLSSGRNAESSMNIVALARCKAPALCKCSKISAAS